MLNFIKKLFMPRGQRFTAGELAKKFGLTLRGSADTVVTGLAPIADAKAGDLAFYSTEKTSATFKILPIEVLKQTRASVILLRPEHEKNAPKGATLLISAHPRADVAKILGAIYAPPRRRGVHFTAHTERGVFFRKKSTNYIGQNVVIERGAVIEPDVQIFANAFIGRNVTLGAGTIIHAGAHIENATLGDSCVIYPGAVIGKDGFGYTRQGDKNVFIQHAGRVILGNHVSVGSCSCIDRGLITDTVIGDETKIDNLCQIAHGVIIGKQCFLAAGTGIAGGVVAGNRVLFGGHVGISNKVQIGDDAEIGAQSGVFRNIPAGEKVMGSPAVNVTEYLRSVAWTRKQIKKN
ncbi:MAG: UDP-3-O-(3-hydroxymyristoyl)glucosamine N-acyltransferase [Proteobacteria bacterium]|nr:UDP-3-O-(3-hydroxymyristoyl)glucosamine N-acyltransferase [Pseudomonadota bacterium]